MVLLMMGTGRVMRMGGGESSGDSGDVDGDCDGNGDVDGDSNC